jgi:hypothetical protein
VVDQAALVGTNKIDLESYYTSELTDRLILDSKEVDKSIRDFVLRRYPGEEILKLEILTDRSQIRVNIEKKSILPFSIGLTHVKVSASATAVLQVN